MNGVWKKTFGSGSRYSLLSYAGGAPRTDAIDAMGDAAWPFREDILWEKVNDRFVLRVPCARDERLYGLGLGFDQLSLRYRVRHQRTDHYGGVDNGRTHVPAPMYVSSAGYAVFVDVAQPVSFYMAGAVRLDAANPPQEKNRGDKDGHWRCEQDADYVEISFVGDGADVYVFSGNTMKEAVARANLFAGGGCLPPKWGLGYWHRADMYADEKEALAAVDACEAHGLHVDVLGLEPGWQTNAYPCTWDWNRDRFPDPSAFVRGLLRRGTRVNLWENPYLSSRAPLFDKIKPYCGSHTVWGGAVPDITMPEACAMLEQWHGAAHADMGVSGYKVDECDGYDEWLWPDHASFPSGTPATVVRNVYGLRLQRVMDAVHKKRGLRTYGLVRAGNMGGAQFPFCIYNDCYSFPQYLTGMLTAGFCGTLWVPEVRGAQSGEEWARRFQLAALSPMLLLNGWTDGLQPWDFPDAWPAVQEAIRLRRMLLPCLYQAFADYHFRGIPPFRSLAMDDATAASGEEQGVLDHTSNPYALSRALDVTDQFLIGESLMAAPVRPFEKTRAVTLPRGVWHDFFTGEAIEGGRTIEIKCLPDTMPLFVRHNAIVPLRGDAPGEMLLCCYGDAGEACFYDDDGVTTRCDEGAHAEIRCRFARTDGVLRGEANAVSFGCDSEYTAFRFVDAPPCFASRQTAQS